MRSTLRYVSRDHFCIVFKAQAGIRFTKKLCNEENKQ